METPTRIIWGEHDAWLVPEVSERIERQLLHADRIVLSEAGHFSMEDRRWPGRWPTGWTTGRL